jgi:choline dehydrogenase-like flavoprotein
MFCLRETSPYGQADRLPRSSPSWVLRRAAGSACGLPIPADRPRIEHRLLGSDDDALQLAEGLQIARKIMAQDAVGAAVTAEVRPAAELQELDSLQAHVRLSALPMFHRSAPKIGAADDADGVVDADLRVRGIDRLWVADASVMPTIPVGNTNDTAIMIVDKASDHILGKLRLGQTSMQMGAVA